ncbi:MAG TPA: PilZ domain-containing protein [Terriglobales bacterium]|nr:PilZ domain-containing protein [Terriglobales bacterium]
MDSASGAVDAGKRVLYSVRRREPRVTRPLTVRLWGLDSAGRPFGSTATTLDISPAGACVHGVRGQLAAGDVVGLQYEDRKARFSVAWVGEPGSEREGQIGLKCLEPEKKVWGKALEEEPPAPPPAAPAAEGPPHGIERRTTGDRRREERRRNPRYRASGGVQMYPAGSDVRVWGTLTDISLGGCYVESMSPLPAATEVALELESDSDRLRARAAVRVSHPGCGMGLEFLAMEEEDRRTLQRILERAAAAAQPAQQGWSRIGATAAGDAAHAAAAPSPEASRLLQELLLFFHERDAMTREDFRQVLERSRARR